MDGKTKGMGWANGLVLLGGMLEGWMGVFEGVEAAEGGLGEEGCQSG